MLEILLFIAGGAIALVGLWVHDSLTYHRGYMDDYNEAKNILYDELQRVLADAKKEKSANDARK